MIIDIPEWALTAVAYFSLGVLSILALFGLLGLWLMFYLYRRDKKGA